MRPCFASIGAIAMAAAPLAAIPLVVPISPAQAEVAVQVESPQPEATMISADKAQPDR